MSVAESLITAEEFADMPDDGRRTELVGGRSIELPFPTIRQGKVCFKVAWFLGQHVEANDLGSILIGVGLITRRNPDSVRAPDIAYYYHNQWPRGLLTDAYCEFAPELIIEIRSWKDRWDDIIGRIAQYLTLGVEVVCILVPEDQSAHLYYPDQPPRTLGPDDELTFPECLPGFSILIRSLFE